MSEKKVFLGADHGGFLLKKFLVSHLTKAGFDVTDMGTDTLDSCDYPNYAKKVCDAVLKEECLGILICGTGIGMSMTANKIPGIRAAICTNEYMARLTRLHNNANILCMGERVLGQDVARDIADVFLNTEFEGGRHQRRIDLMGK